MSSLLLLSYCKVHEDEDKGEGDYGGQENDGDGDVMLTLLCKGNGMVIIIAVMLSDA